jgi:hypothetical protein
MPLTLQEEVENFVNKWGPSTANAFCNFVCDLQALANAYASEASRAGSLPDAAYHACINKIDEFSPQPGGERRARKRK